MPTTHGGNTTTTYHNGGASTGARYNPIRYRGYYYDRDLGMYWLQTRLYNPSLRRFMSPDSYVSTGQGLTGYNMYAYCGNDPVNRIDLSGAFWKEICTFFQEVVSQVGSVLASTAPAYATAGGVAIADGPLPFGDIIAVGIIAATTVSVIAGSIYAAEQESDAVVSDSEESTLVIPPKNQAIFTPNPYDFNPKWLIRSEYPGTRKGKIIKWFDPATKQAIFEWDEDPQYGPHYHILFMGEHVGDHNKPGSLVPEPYNSRYFGG